jgi:Ca-activated chloride channel homolog
VKRIRPVAGLAVAIALLVGVTSAQQATFRTVVDLVRLDVLVTDGHAPIGGLKPGDFEVWDSGKPQAIDTVSSESGGVDVVLCFDVSESVAGDTLVALRDAARAVLSSLQPADRAQLLTFSHRIELRTALTNDFALLSHALDSVAASGSTSLLDGLYTALALGELGGRRSMILLFSDGRDNRSWLSRAEVVQVVRETDTVIYAVAFRPRGRAGVSTTPDAQLLERITEDAGGRLVWCQDPATMKALFLELLTEMRARYVLTYYPRGVPETGWHPLRVTLRNVKAKVKARPGYTVSRR